MTTTDNNYDVLNGSFQVTEGQMQTVAGGAHLIANFMPLGTGTIVDGVGSYLDKEHVQESIMHTWKSSIAKRLGVDESELKGEHGRQLVAIAVEEGRLPPPLEKEWNEAEALADKAMNFMTSNAAQIGAMALIGGIPGMALGFGTSAVMPNFFGEKENPTVGAIISAIHNLAKSEKEEHGHNVIKADRSLVGLYIMLSDDTLMKDYDRGDLLEKFQAHINEKQKDPYAHTDLDRMMEDLDYDKNAFVSYIPEGTNMGKFSSTSPLDIIRDQIKEQKDLGAILFEPEVFKQKIYDVSMGKMVQAATQTKAPSGADAVRQAGRSLHQQMQGVSGEPARIPVPADKGPGLSA